MNACHGLATKKETGLDLILHTPGGSIGATEAIVHYLRQMFGCNIRVIVPQIAMSAGTMIALASKEIILGKQSSLGPIDPQFNGIPANLIIKEFTQAQQELSQDPSRTPYWQIRLAKYPATWFYQAELAVRRAKETFASGCFRICLREEVRMLTLWSTISLLSFLTPMQTWLMIGISI